MYFCIRIMENLKEKTARGLMWGAVNSGTTQLLNLFFGLLLARMLSPQEYGIVGVLTIFTVIAGNLQSSGFSQGLVNLKSPTWEDYNSVFWFNITASLIIYAVLFCCAPLIAAFFHQPVLVTVSRVVFLSFVISSFGIAQNAYMIKNMMQREIMISSVVALVASGSIGIALAFMKYSYWSLVWQQIIYISVLNIGRYFYSDWRPSFHFTMAPVRRMFSFSVKILITNILNTLSQNLLTFIFGRVFPMSTVGNFSQANKWNTMGYTTISNTLNQVAQTVLVSVEDERDRELRVFRKMLRFTAFLSFPALFGLALVGQEFILLCLGNTWKGTVPILQVLCIGGAFLPFYTLYQNLIISNRRSDLYLWCNSAQILVQLAMVLLLYPQGVMVIVVAYTVLNIAWLFVWQALAKRLIGLHFKDAFVDVVPYMLASLFVMAVTYFSTVFLTANYPLLLLTRIVMASSLYFLLMKAAKVKVLDECIKALFHKVQQPK